jgi:hypothetical protein
MVDFCRVSLVFSETILQPKINLSHNPLQNIHHRLNAWGTYLFLHLPVLELLLPCFSRQVASVNGSESYRAFLQSDP